MYKMFKCLEGVWRGYWEVDHRWEDGITVQCKYFKTKKEAEKYVEEHS